MVPAQVIGRFQPTSDIVEYMAESGLKWNYQMQRFVADASEWWAHVGLRLDGRWIAGYKGIASPRWESAKFDDPIACLLNAKLENWGN